MQVSFALFADAANLSQEGKLNVLGVFDAVQVGGFPAVHPRAHLVVRFKGTRTDVGNHSISLAWTNPKGAELWSSTGEMNVAAPPVGVNEMDFPLIAALDLPLDMAGPFTMTVALDGQPRASVTLQVRSVATAMPGMAAPPSKNGLVS